MRRAKFRHVYRKSKSKIWTPAIWTLSDVAIWNRRRRWWMKRQNAPVAQTAAIRAHRPLTARLRSTGMSGRKRNGVNIGTPATSRATGPLGTRLTAWITATLSSGFSTPEAKGACLSSGWSQRAIYEPPIRIPSAKSRYTGVCRLKFGKVRCATATG